MKKKLPLKEKKTEYKDSIKETIIEDVNSKTEKNMDLSLSNKKPIKPATIKFVPTKTLKKQNTLPKALNNDEDKSVSSADFLKSGVDSIYSFQSAGFKNIESLELARNSIKLKERADSFKRFKIRKLTNRPINQKWLKPDTEVKENLIEDLEDNQNKSSIKSNTKLLENQPSKSIDCSVTIKPTTKSEIETKPSDQPTKSSSFSTEDLVKESNNEKSCNTLESSESDKKETISKDTEEVEGKILVEISNLITQFFWLIL